MTGPGVPVAAADPRGTDVDDHPALRRDGLGDVDHGGHAADSMDANGAHRANLPAPSAV